LQLHNLLIQRFGFVYHERACVLQTSVDILWTFPAEHNHCKFKFWVSHSELLIIIHGHLSAQLQWCSAGVWARSYSDVLRASERAVTVMFCGRLSAQLQSCSAGVWAHCHSCNYFLLCHHCHQLSDRDTNLLVLWPFSSWILQCFWNPVNSETFRSLISKQAGQVQPYPLALVSNGDVAGWTAWPKNLIRK